MKKLAIRVFFGRDRTYGGGYVQGLTVGIALTSIYWIIVFVVGFNHR